GLCRFHFLPGTGDLGEHRERVERCDGTFGAVRFGKSGDGVHQQRGGQGRIDSRGISLGGGQQQRDRIDGDRLGGGELGGGLRQKFGILFREGKDPLQRVVGLDAVAVHFLDEECRLFRIRLRESFLQRGDDLRGLTPWLRL